MGMFSCFQDPLPRALKRCPSVCTSFWEDSSSDDNPEPPESPIVREHKPVEHSSHSSHHDHPIQRTRDPDSFPPLEIPEPTNLSRPRHATATTENRSSFRNPSSIPQPAKKQFPSPSSPRGVVKAQNSSPLLEHTQTRNPFPNKRVLGHRRHSKCSRGARRRHPSAPPRLARGQNRSPPKESRKAVQDQNQPLPIQPAKHQNPSPPRSRALDYSSIRPPDSIFQDLQTSPRCEVAELVDQQTRTLPLGSRNSSPSRNAPIVLLRTLKKRRHLKGCTPSFIRCRRLKETLSDCYSPTRPSGSNDADSKSLRSILCHHRPKKSQMTGKGHDTDHIHEWEEHNCSSDGGHTLAIELKRDVQHDLAQHAAKGRERLESPRSVTESCADSYCTRAENPLKQKSYESKFPYGTPEIRPISPPGWTYAPKRKNKKGEWWDKDWPKNKRYIYHDSKLRPCGCSWSKKHAGTRTPSPPVSARTRGMVYADQVVKINRERSLSPQSKSGPNLVPTSEQPAKYSHRHVHLDWSCSNSSRTSSRAASRPVSRAITPTVKSKETIRTSDSTPYPSLPQSRTLTQHRTTKVTLYPSKAPEQPESHPSTGGGYSAPLSRSTTTTTTTTPRARRKHRHVVNVRDYPDSPCTSSPSTKRVSRRIVRYTRPSAPLRQRPDDQDDLQIYLSSSSGRSTPCSISVRRNSSYDDQVGGSRKKYVGTMGHCHTPGSWSCTPQDSTPTTPRRTSTPTRETPEYTVTITCSTDDDPKESEAYETDMPESEPCCDCLCHCPCTQNYADQGCYDNQFCQTTPRRVIGGRCDWRQVVHHHRPVSHCCCGCCPCDG